MDTHYTRPPESFPRRILLAVSGLTPQILTETLYALAVDRSPAFVPTEIRLITTREGGHRARLSLLSDDPGWLQRLCRDYQLPEIHFDASCILTPLDANGAPMEDLRTPEDNMRMADLITSQIRELTSDPQTALHVSIAGGRKTMGYYAGYALSLFGRAQERLSHVLVSEPFEASWEFFYPTPYSRVIQTRDNTLIDTREARVTLAEIPFVRLRSGLPERLQNGSSGFAETIRAAQRAQQPPELIIDLAQCRLGIAGERINLEPRLLAFYSLMARRCLQQRDPVRWTDDEIGRLYLDEYVQILNDLDGRVTQAETTLAEGMSPELFSSLKSRIKGCLEDTLGETLAAPYLIQSFGKRPKTRYGLKLDPGAIRYQSLPDEPPAA